MESSLSASLPVFQPVNEAPTKASLMKISSYWNAGNGCQLRHHIMSQVSVIAIPAIRGANYVLECIAMEIKVRVLGTPSG